MNEPMFTTRIYKTNKGWSFENILADANGVKETTCNDLPEYVAWMNFMYYLNHSLSLIKSFRARDLTEW